MTNVAITKERQVHRMARGNPIYLFLELLELVLLLLAVVFYFFLGFRTGCLDSLRAVLRGLLDDSRSVGAEGGRDCTLSGCLG